jgi:hypothetical protein
LIQSTRARLPKELFGLGDKSVSAVIQSDLDSAIEIDNWGSEASGKVREVLGVLLTEAEISTSLFATASPMGARDATHWEKRAGDLGLE